MPMYSVIIPYSAANCVQKLLSASGHLSLKKVEHEFLILASDSSLFENNPQFRSIKSEPGVQAFRTMVKAASGEKICCFFGAEFLSEKVPAKLYYSCSSAVQVVSSRIKGKPRGLLSVIIYDVIATLIHLCFSAPYFDSFMPFCFFKEHAVTVKSHSSFYSAEFLIYANKKRLKMRDVNIMYEFQKRRTVKIPGISNVMDYLGDAVRFMIRIPSLKTVEVKR